MKLIIDISEEDYNYVKKQVADGIINPLKVRIADGTPLDDVKAEIKTFTITEKSEYDTGFNDAVLKCFNVLGNIGKGSEVKPNDYNKV